MHFIVIVLICPMIGQAQLRYGGLNKPDHDLQSYHFGINLGMNKSHFSFTHHPQFLGQDSVTTIESINSTGINLAWLVNINLSKHFDFRTYPFNLTFSEKAFEYGLTYPDLPIGESKLNKLDYSIEGGIGFHIYFPYFVLSPELKVSWGLSNLHSRNPGLKFSNNIDKINSRMISFSLTVE